ncbi:MAG: hypothetical protein V1861_02045 [Candidatus Micrarchaeota archaeon]
MTGGAMREASAETRMDARALETLRSNLVTQLTGIRTQFDTMRRNSIPPVVTYTDPSMTALLETLATNATALNIPITGTTREERFRSLNNWLNTAYRDRTALTGRNQDSAIDPAALEELTTRLTIAVAATAASAVATAVVPTIAPPTSAAPSSAAPGPVLPVPVPVPSGPAVTGGAREAGAAVAAAPTTETAAPVPLRTQNAQLLADLEMISTWGRTAQIRTRASTLMRELNAQFDARHPNTRTIDTKLGQARTLITAELPLAEQRVAEDRQRAYETAAGAPHPLRDQISTLSTTVQGLTGATAELIRRRIPDLYLLDDASLRQMYGYLNEAATALSGGNETQAQEKARLATELFDRQQATYMRQVGLVRQIAQASVTEVHASSLPTREQLQGFERTHGQQAGAYYNVPVREVPAGGGQGRVLRRIATARSDLEARMQTRVTAATTLEGQAGRLSYAAVRALSSATTSDTERLHQLISYYNYASTHGLDSATDASTFYLAYSRAAVLVADPTVNAFSIISPEQQTSLIRSYLGIPAGREITTEQRRQAVRELTAPLMQNEQLTYDYLFYGVFDQTVRRMQPSGDQTIQRLANVRSLRLTYELDYLAYQKGITPTNIRDSSGIAISDADQLARLSAEYPQYRFRSARSMLETAMQTARDSGMAADSEVIRAAQAYLTATRTAPAADRLVATADTLYNMALSLLSIREAELWAGSSSLRSPSADAATVRTAQEQIDRARRAFVWSFSVPEAGPAYHYNVARRLADDAVQQLAPNGFLSTESSGMYFVRGGYLSPTDHGVTVSGTEPTETEQRRGAAAAEQRYLSFLVSLNERANASLFTPSASETVLRQAGLYGPMRVLDQRVGRIRPEQELTAPHLGGYPDLTPEMRRVRPSASAVDINFIPQRSASVIQFADRAQEDVDLNVYGQTYVELRRQVFMLGSTATPALLHGFDIAPASYPVRPEAQFRQQDQRLKDRLLAIAREYGLATDRPLLDSLRERMMTVSASYSQAMATTDDAARTRLLGEYQQSANRLLLAVLDVRLAQLETRLGGNVMLADGQPIRITDLTRSTDPRAYTVRRAQQMLTEAQAMRSALSTSGDMFARGMQPREAIAISEMGIASLTDEILRPIPRPPQPTFAATVPSDAISRDRSSRVNEQRDRETILTFTASRTMITPAGGREVSLTDYERQNGAQNLTYYWFMFQDIQPSTGLLLLNPRYRDTQTQPPPLRYTGMLMRGVTLTDGTTGDFVVRVRRVDAPSRDLEWAAVTEANGRIRPENVVFQMRSGTMDPVPDARLERNIDQSSFWRYHEMGQPDQATVVEHGPITPVLIVRPSATNATPPATAAPARPPAPAASSQKKK